MSMDKNFQISFYEKILQHNPHYVDVIELLASLYTQEGRIDDGLKMDRKLIRLMPESPSAHYNLACSLALKNRKADAVKELHRALDLGYDDFKWLTGDPDLKSLYGYEAFDAILKRIAQKGG
jgi:tetratricopeptide (TPR) repeat protein